MKKSREQLIGELENRMCELTGTRTYGVAGRLLSQLASLQVFPEPEGKTDQFSNAITAIAEMAPRNSIEAMLAV